MVHTSYSTEPSSNSCARLKQMRYEPATSIKEKENSMFKEGDLVSTPNGVGIVVQVGSEAKQNVVELVFKHVFVLLNTSETRCFMDWEICGVEEVIA